MPSMREQVLSALLGQLRAIPLATVKRNEALPAGPCRLQDSSPCATANRVSPMSR